jgi:DNA-binding response OmpR family regulator
VIAIQRDLSAPPRNSRLRVLVCEDDDSLRELVRITLEQEHEVVEARDGREAVALASTFRPDIVIVDLMLPLVSGMDVIAALRADPATAGARVIALSAWSHMDGEAVAGGADRFVAKPFDPDGLRAAVAELGGVA